MQKSDLVLRSLKLDRNQDAKLAALAKDKKISKSALIRMMLDNGIIAAESEALLNAQ